MTNKNFKHVLPLSLALTITAATFAGCKSKTPAPAQETTTQVQTTQAQTTQAESTATTEENSGSKIVADGNYRGSYYSGGEEQVSLMIDVKNNKFETIKFRSLAYEGVNYLAEDANDVYKQVAAQYQEITDYLTGKDISALRDVYDPAKVSSDKDAVTAATLRVSKFISAANDAFNRGVYKPTDTTVYPKEAAYSDGNYRGSYYSGGEEQISLMVDLKDNQFEKITMRSLAYDGIDYLAEDAADVYKQITAQYQELSDYLIGKNISALNDLYDPSAAASDKDAVTAATLRSAKFISATRDALNRGVYKLADTTSFDEEKNYEDGNYRGSYYSGGEEQVSLMIDIKNNTFEKITIRSLAYDGVDYLAKDANDVYKQIATQYQEVADFLVGKDIATLNTLYDPSVATTDKDAVTAATLRTAKFISATRDALNRGKYK